MPQKMKFRVEFVVADRENRGLPRNHSQKPSIRKSFTLQRDILTLKSPLSLLTGVALCEAGLTLTLGGYATEKANSYQFSSMIPRIAAVGCPLESRMAKPPQ
jgi:hypothetical protein